MPHAPHPSRRAVLLALLMGLGASGAPLAGPSAEGPVLRVGGGVNESAAAAAARSATGGRVVGVRRSGDIFEVTVLLVDGQVRVVRVDAASGRVVGG